MSKSKFPNACDFGQKRAAPGMEAAIPILGLDSLGNPSALTDLGNKRTTQISGWFQCVHGCAPVCVYVLDNFISSGYTGNRKGAAGRRWPPSGLQK